MPKLTFNVETFKDDLFEYLGEKFDEAEENGKTLEDSPFLSKLSRMTVDTESEIYVSHLIREIKDYVKLCHKGGSQIGPIVQELYDLIEFDFRNSLAFLINSVDTDPVKKDEFVQLVMQHFEEHEAYNGYLVHNDEPLEHESMPPVAGEHPLAPTIAALYYRLNQVIAEGSPHSNRMQIIVRQQEHYTLIDIDKAARSAFVIDSSGDAKALILNDFARYSAHIDKVYHVAEHEYDRPLSGCPSGPGGGKGISRMQKDGWSCSVFALEFSRLVARSPSLHQLLEQQSAPVLGTESQYCLSWEMLGPEFVAISQSPTYRYYHAENLRAATPDVIIDWERNGLFGQRRDEFKSIALTRLEQENTPDLLERYKHKTQSYQYASPQDIDKPFRHTDDSPFAPYK